MRSLLPIFLVLFSSSLPAQQKTSAVPPLKVESSNYTHTPSYHEIISWWKQMDTVSPYIKMQEAGPTDAGYPLHLILISSDKNFSISLARKKHKAIVFVLNGIHPGEPDGIDASMLLAKAIHLQLEKGKDINNDERILADNVLLAIIPVYNIGGTLNRSSFYRVDQNGPEEFGFRGNSQNLDLNRDFIKNDSREALSFSKIFRKLDPDIFIDNHVSNGADYQHVMTLLTTQHNKLGGKLGEYLHQVMEPEIYAGMKRKGWDLVPYVNHFGDSPEKGWSEFWDSPRYSSGYAALWNSFSFVPETHMLKPYRQRVQATLDLMKTFLEFASDKARKLIDLRREAIKEQQQKLLFPIAWKQDRSTFDSVLFKGYESGKKESLISGQLRLFYDRSKPFERKVPFYNHYRDTLSVSKPKAYVLPAGWWKVAERLKANEIEMKPLTRDTIIEVEWYHIESYQSGSRPFEGHHINYYVQTSLKKEKILFHKGDWYIPMNQIANKFLMAVLEPRGEDSYFAWNFFDPVLGQKEGFSDYVFEETAYRYLQNNPELQQKLNDRKASDSSFALNGRAQLNYIYQHSPYFESSYMRYPVYRVVELIER